MTNQKNTKKAATKNVTSLIQVQQTNYLRLLYKRQVISALNIISNVNNCNYISAFDSKLARLTKCIALAPK